ncbi:MAG: PD40 domain-containing protein [Dehalococcoidales bacterium]|nr:PD40 domain-containing protein [Dehalococcoidales bacterium]
MGNFGVKTCVSLFLSMSILATSLPFIPSNAVHAAGEETVLPGDITGDGTVDSRDALKIMRFAGGYETATESEIKLGDVYPVPGTEGRVRGDGQLTAGDALWILQYTVGLVTEGEVTGDFDNSSPVLYGMEPGHGSPGTQVTILGDNFISSSALENMVYFGEVPATIDSASSTEIITHVPQGAESAIITVVTPAGEAVSPFEFTITVPGEGQLEPPSGMDSGDFVLVNKFGDEVNPEQDGSYQMPIDVHGVTLESALPEDGSDTILLRIDLTDGSTPQPSRMNLLTTAEAMVFLSPYFSTLNPERARQHMPYIQNDPKVAELAQVLDQLYQESDSPFDDVRFDAAYSAAIDSVISRMPDNLIMEIQPVESVSSILQVSGYEPASSNLEENAVLSNFYEEDPETDSYYQMMEEVHKQDGEDWQKNSLKVYYPDSVLTGVGESKSPGAIKPEITVSGFLEGWSPVDWLVHLAMVKDPRSVFRYGEQSLTAFNPGTYVGREGMEGMTFISSNSYTKYIDLFGCLFGVVWDGLFEGIGETAAEYGWDYLKGAASPDGDLHVPAETDSVYIVRNYSGVLGLGSHTSEYNMAWGLPDGNQDFWIALAFNTAMAAIDAASVFIDVKTAVAGKEVNVKLRNIIKRAFKKGIRLAIKKLPKGTTGIGTAELCKTIVSIINAVTMDITCVVAGDVAADALEGSVSKILKFIGKSIEPLYKISVGSAAVERTIALLGFHRNASPLETWLLVVGEPFRPQVTAISSTEGPPGEEVILTGKNFDNRSKDMNEVRLGEYWHEAVPVDVISVTGEYNMNIRIPEDISYGEHKILIRTKYSGGSVDTGKTYTVKRIPKITGISPATGFAASSNLAGNPFNDYWGDVVVIKGVGFGAPYGEPADKLYFGTTDAAQKITSITSTEIKVRVPEISPGTYDVYIDSPQWSVETSRHSYTVLGPPTITSISDTEATVGQLITLTGTNFGYDPNTVRVLLSSGNFATVVSVNNTSLYFRMSTGVDPGETINLTVYTPAGNTDSTTTITRVAGITIPEPPSVSSGCTILVNSTSTTNNGADGFISLDDAALFARGSANPFSPPWDDRDEKYYKHFYEYKEFNEETQQWVSKWEERETQGPVYESEYGHEGHEYRYYYHSYHYLDETVNGPTLQPSDTVDLDETQLEEGDSVVFPYKGNASMIGAGYADHIFAGSTGTYHAVNLVLGDGDSISMEPESTLLLGGTGIAPGDSCRLILGTVEGVGITINGNLNTIENVVLRNIEGNGITINGGIGNYIDPSSEDQVLAANCTGHGVYINGGSGNQIDVQISQAGGHGIYVKNGEQNNIGGQITGCTGNGIVIEGGRANTTSGDINSCEYGIEASDTNESYLSGNIRDCCRSGIYIHEGYNNKVDQCRLEYNQGHGLELVNTMLVSATSSLYSVNNTGNGIHLGNNCVSNLFDGSSVMGNENGIYLEGPGTHTNTFTHYFGVGVGGSFYVTDPVVGDGSYYNGNRKNGVYLTGGAHDNGFDDLAIHGSGEYGVLITGEGTDRNDFLYTNIGMEGDFLYAPLNPYLEGNKLGGVLVCDGASDNSFYYCNIGKSEGNGVTITGLGTDNTTLDYCKIGCMLGEADNKSSPWLNGGYGILVQDRAFDTTITYCEIGVNRAGGIRFEGITREWSEDEEPFWLAYLYRNHIGYGYTGTYSSKRKALLGTSGDGIHLNGSTDILVDSNWTIYHDRGICIDGENSGFNILNGCTTRYALNQGIYVDGSTGDQIFSGSYYSGSHGLHLNKTKDVEVRVSAFNENHGDGIYLYQAHGTMIKAKKLGPLSKQMMSCNNNDDSGLHIEDSDNISVYLANFERNFEHGIFIEGGCSTIDIEAPYIDQNVGSGLYITGSNDVDVYSNNEDMMLILANHIDGVTIDNASDIQIGLPNQNVSNIAENERRGILVSGDQTENVKICGITFIGENFLEGVKITGGNDITIGGYSSAEGNSVEWNGTTGILVTGSATNVSILNNNIGEPEEWESGTREFGNYTGISIEGPVSDTYINGNTINCNQSDGIALSDGACGNTITGNAITDNGGDGVSIAGTSSVNNMISSNSITGNVEKGISLVSGGNGMIEPPTITAVTWRGYTISGTVTAPKGSEVEVYSDLDDEGEKYLGTSRVYGNNFYINSDVPEGRNLHAIVVYPDGNTSEFGDCQIDTTGMALTAFTSSRYGNQEIFILEHGGLSPIRLTNEPAADYSPQISSNQHYIMFVTERDGNPDIWTMALDGSSQSPLVTGPVADYDPAWSFNDEQIAFVSESEGNAEIYKLDVIPGAPVGCVAYDNGEYGYTKYVNSENDTSAVLFTTQGGILTELQFYISANPVEFKWVVLNVEDNRPGSNIIAQGTSTPLETGWHSVDIADVEVDSEFVVGLVYDANKQPGIGANDPWPDAPAYRSWNYSASSDSWWLDSADYLIRATVEVNPQRVTSDPAEDRQPVWSPDGTRLAFTSDRAGNDDIWIMNANGTGLLQLTMDDAADYSPAWSPDGSKILFVSERNGNAEIYVIGADGNNMMRLTENTFIDTDPAWSIDGSLILFSSNRDSGMELYTMLPDGNMTTRKTTSLGDTIQPNAGRPMVVSDAQEQSFLRNLLVVNPEDRTAFEYLMTQEPRKDAVSEVTTPEAQVYVMPDLQSETNSYLVVDSGNISPSGTVNLTLHLHDAVNLGNLGFNLDYDYARVRLVNISGEHLTSISNSIFAMNPVACPDYSGTVRFNWICPEGFNGTGDIITLTFSLNDEACPGASDIILSNVVAYETDLSVMPIIHSDGKLTVSASAETSLSEGLDDERVAVVKIKIDGFEQSADNEMISLPGGLGGYSAQISLPSEGIEVMAVTGVGAFSEVSYNSTSGVFSSENLTAEADPTDLVVAEVIIKLTGSALQAYTMNVTFTSIYAALDPSVIIPAKTVNSMTFLRGDLSGEGVVDLDDSYIAAMIYLTKMSPDAFRVVNGASAYDDGNNRLDLDDSYNLAMRYLTKNDEYFRYNN